MKTFNDIVVEILHIPAGNIRDDLKSTDVSDWDSMNYLLFIAEIEKEFDMSFTMDEVMNAQTLGDIHTIVTARGTQ